MLSMFDKLGAELIVLQTSRPEYNQILVKKPGGGDFWPY